MPSLTLKHIASVTVALPHLANSSGARSSRLFLSSLPATPSSKHPAVPQVVVRTVDGPGWIEAVYSDKSKLKVDTSASMSRAELFRKIEEPAKRIRLKEEGL
ncbi:unnamed protein product [Parajaminaea phylloscopi]